jgi:hypothetical protein
MDRALLFVDGNNWYHSLKEIGVRDRSRLDYLAKLPARIDKQVYKDLVSLGSAIEPYRS